MDSDAAAPPAYRPAGGKRHRVFLYRGFCVHEAVSTTSQVAMLTGMQSLVGTVASLTAVVCLSVMTAISSQDLEYALSVNPAYDEVPGRLIGGENVLEAGATWGWNFTRWAVGLTEWGFCAAVLAMITSVMLHFKLTAACVPPDGHALLVQWLRTNYVFLVVENVLLVGSIVLSVFSLYFMLKIRYPTVVRTRDMLIQGTGYGAMLLWVAIMAGGAYTHTAGFLTDVRTLHDPATGELVYDVVDVAPARWSACLPSGRRQRSRELSSMANARGGRRAAAAPPDGPADA